MRRFSLSKRLSPAMAAWMMASCRSHATTNEFFQNIPEGPPDPILGLSVAFQKDTDKSKVNLGVGVYRGDDNAPFVLNAIKAASTHIQHFDHEYAAISGIPSFVQQAQLLAFGEEHVAVQAKRIASSQSISGTGALRVAAEFLAKWHKPGTIALPDPTWGNHIPIMKDSHLEVVRYRYYDKASNKVAFDALLEDLESFSAGQIVLLHACAHNPTGMDPTQAQWEDIVKVIEKKCLLPFVDMAYQGFASGDTAKDAFLPRLLAKKVPNMVLCQSFAKSFGVYGQRTGAVHFVCADQSEAEKVLSQLKILIRPMYSNPPIHGARLVDTILRNKALREGWQFELKQMAKRMNAIRVRLVEELKKVGSTKDWGHITTQIGMMAFTGMNKDQVARLKKEYHIYMTDDGRAAISGLNSTNVEYVAKAFHEVTK